MANSLLDFVVSLVRDPDAAARYAADPGQAIAEANLSGVTSADVNNLIPVVSESLPIGGSPVDGAFGGAESASNVWASGAATAAFDAFADPVGEPLIDDSETWVAPVIDTTEPEPVDDIGDLATQVTAVDDVPLQLDTDITDDGVIDEMPPIDDWNDASAAVEPVDDADPGFDLFN